MWTIIASPQVPQEALQLFPTTKEQDMTWFLTILGFVIGSSLASFSGGIIGAIIGFVIAANISDDDEDGEELSEDLLAILREDDSSDFEQSNDIYDSTSSSIPAPRTGGIDRSQARHLLKTSYLELLLSIMQADGELYQEEFEGIIKIYDLMRFNKEEKQELKTRLGRRLKRGTDARASATALLKLSLTERTFLMEGLYRVAYADDEFHKKEFELIQQVGAYLQVQEHWNVIQSIEGRLRVKNQNTSGTPTGKQARIALGLAGNATTTDALQRHQELLSFYENVSFSYLNHEMQTLKNKAIKELTTFAKVLQTELRTGTSSATRTAPTPPTPPKAAMVTSRTAPTPPRPSSSRSTKSGTPAYGSTSFKKSRHSHDASNRLLSPTTATVDIEHTKNMLDALWNQSDSGEDLGTPDLLEQVRQSLSGFSFGPDGGLPEGAAEVLQSSQDAMSMSTDLASFLSSSTAQTEDNTLTTEDYVELLCDFDPETRQQGVAYFVNSGSKVLQQLTPHIDRYLIRPGVKEIFKLMGPAGFDALLRLIGQVDDFEKEWLIPILLESDAQRAQGVLVRYLKSENLLLSYCAQEALMRSGMNEQQLTQLRASV
tara:strand:- start:3415 stop:5217 length:1803 start_codon:yes stop_codon:yes gene_type:complete